MGYEVLKVQTKTKEEAQQMKAELALRAQEAGHHTLNPFVVHLLKLVAAGWTLTKPRKPKKEKEVE